jgi:hypothetical protein
MVGSDGRLRRTSPAGPTQTVSRVVPAVCKVNIGRALSCHEQAHRPLIGEGQLHDPRYVTPLRPRCHVAGVTVSASRGAAILKLRHYPAKGERDSQLRRSEYFLGLI